MYCFPARFIERKQLRNLTARRGYTTSASLAPKYDHTIAAPCSGVPFWSIADHLYRTAADVYLF